LIKKHEYVIMPLLFNSCLQTAKYYESSFLFERVVGLEEKGSLMASKNLYVGNLPFSLDSAGLEVLFKEAGAVTSASVIIDRMSGRSRGFGFVEMASDAEAQKAIEMLSGKEIEGRKLIVNEARPKEERPERSFRPRR